MRNSGTIYFDDVSFGYASKQVLEKFTVAMNVEGITCLVGESGCGKTTLLELVIGTKHPDSGRIDRPKEFEGRIGWVPQGGGIFPWLTVRENIMFGRKRKVENSSSDHEYMQVQDIAEALGIVEILDRWPKNISGGQCQRAAIARAIAADAKVLVLDEPLSGLDFKTREATRELIAKVCRENNLSIIFTSHDFLDAANLADNVYIFPGTKNSTLYSFAVPKRDFGRGRDIKTMTTIASKLRQSFNSEHKSASVIES